MAGILMLRLLVRVIILRKVNSRYGRFHPVVGFLSPADMFLAKDREWWGGGGLGVCGRKSEIRLFCQTS